MNIPLPKGDHHAPAVHTLLGERMDRIKASVAETGPAIMNCSNSVFKHKLQAQYCTFFPQMQGSQCNTISDRNSLGAFSLVRMAESTRTYYTAN